MNPLQSVIDRFGTRRIAVLGIGLLAALLLLGVSRVISAPRFVPAFSNIPLEQTSRITEKLSGAGIPYELDASGGQVLVPEADLAKARVTVAASGGAGGSRPGMELFDQPTWGMTDFTQRINYRRALEGEMERTIGRMRGIEAAQVHLTLPDRSTLRRPTADRTEASVVLKLSNGATPAADVVQGIAQLVAASVEGLKADDVTIISEEGRLLSIPSDDGTGLGLTSRQLQIQRDLENDLEAKVATMLGPIVGPGNARVQITAQMNFDRVERTTQTIDPDRQAVNTEQKAEIIPGAQGGAGSVNMAKSYENSRAVENYYGSQGSVKRLTVAVLVNELAQYDSTTKKTTTVRRTPAELATIRDLVRTAVGADSARGDELSVVSLSFGGIEKPSPEAPPGVWDRLQSNQRTLLNALGLVFAFVLTIMALRMVQAKPGGAASPALGGRPAVPAAAVPGYAAAVTGDGLPTPFPGDPTPTRPEPPPIRLRPAQPPVLGGAREQITAQITQSPETATRLVRQWLRDG